MKRAQDLTGQRFGRLVALKQTERTDGHTKWYLCECDCGNVKEVRASCLKRGDTKSCGCLSRELASERGKNLLQKHGWYGTRLYSIWHQIVDRCTNPKCKHYKDYGGRGIALCKEWRENPSSFCEWAMANGYDDSLSIDRIDNNGNYQPSNCRWITLAKQQTNKRNNVLLTYNGKTQCIAEWIRELGLNKNRTYNRIKNGWTDVEEIFFSTRDKRKERYYG